MNQFERALFVRTTPDSLMKMLKKKYVEELGSMDDRAYFMAGFLMSVLEDLKHNSDVIKPETPTELIVEFKE